MACKTKKKYQSGGYLDDILLGAGSGALGGISLGPIGAIGGALVGGVGSFINAQQDQKQADALAQQQRYNSIINMQHPDIMQAQQGYALGGDMGNSVPMSDMQISQFKGGNGMTDSIQLGNVANVDDGEVRYKIGDIDYIFSNTLTI